MEYFYRIHGKVFGPVPAKKLWDVLQSNEKSIGEIHVRRSDKTAWVPANKVRTKSSKSDPTLSLSGSSDSTPYLDDYANDSFTFETPIDVSLMPRDPPLREVPPDERLAQRTSTNPIPEVPIKFQAMRAIAMIYKLVSLLFLSIAVVGAMMVMIAGIGVISHQSYDPVAKDAWGLAFKGLWVFGFGTIAGIIFYAIAESIMLGVQIEHNQRVAISLMESRAVAIE
jgi:hypothetical protein